MRLHTALPIAILAAWVAPALAQKAYVPDVAVGGGVLIVDLASLSVTGSIPSLPPSRELTPSQDEELVYAIEVGLQQVAVIDTASDALVAEFPVGNNPTDLALSPNGSRLWIACATNWTLEILDTSSGAIVQTVALADRPDDLVFAPDGSEVYVLEKVTGGFSHKIEVRAAGSGALTGTIPIAGFGATGLEITPDGTELYVTYSSSAMVVTASTATQTVTGTLNTPSGQLGLEFSAAGDLVYIPCWSAATVQVRDVSTKAVVDTWTFASGFTYLDIDSGGSTCAYTDIASDELRLVNLADGMVSGAVPLGFDALEVLVLRDDGGLGTNYCTSDSNSTGAPASISASGSLSIADGDLTLAAQPVPNQPGIFFFGPDAIQAPFGNGFRCVGGFLVRLLPPTTASGQVATRTFDPAAFGMSAGLHRFQYWFRDPAAGGAAFDLSDGLELTLTP